MNFLIILSHQQTYRNNCQWNEVEQRKMDDVKQFRIKLLPIEDAYRFAAVFRGDSDRVSPVEFRRTVQDARYPDGENYGLKPN